MQTTASYARGNFHATTSASNLLLNGGYLDYGTQTYQPGFARIRYIDEVASAGPEEVEQLMDILPALLKKRGLLGGKDVEFDRVTDWWLLAWSDFQAAEFPAPEALKLSLATHLDLDTLSKTHKVIKATAGKVTLLTPAQRRTAKGLDVDAAAYESMIDALHALMLVYEEDGTRAAQAWLNRHDLTDDVRFKELVGAAIHAVPRRKNKGVFVRPEARVLDSLRTSFFDDLDLPPDPDAELLAAPQALF